MPTIPQTQTNLLSYFQTGDVPSQDQFAEFIGTMFYLYNETVANTAAAAASAAAAAASLTAALSQIPAVVATVQYNGDLNIWQLIGSSANVASLDDGTSPYLKINFTTAFADTNYKVFWSGTAQPINAVNVAWLQITPTSGGGAGPYTFVIFK